MNLDKDLHATKLGAFVAQLQPREWNRLEKVIAQSTEQLEKTIDLRRDVERFFDWPPDVFLLTSLLLKHTGAYRGCLTMPGNDAWPERDWRDTCRQRAIEWREGLCRAQKFGERPQWKGWIREAISAIDEKFCNVQLTHLYSAERRHDAAVDEAARSPWELTKLLLELHTVADEVMRNVGTLASPLVSIEREEHSTVPAGMEWLHLQANVLLALRGTLSRIGKHRGIVLPKTRTAQVGATLRSLSHYLSFHETEVNVLWRAVPWVNIDENTVNALVVPWPYTIDSHAFQPDKDVNVSRLGHSRYFTYAPKQNRSGGTDRSDGISLVASTVCSLLERARKESSRVHIVILPEAAMTLGDLKTLQRSLQRRFPSQDMPIIISGVGGRDPDGATLNRVVLSVHYVGKWFDIEQDKHHRWKLDPLQIARYGLSGVLGGTRTWWESIPVPRRKLTFLTSNAWLTIAPLICEDLARLDPVSGVIRGVGPTLLVALLLDGPQLPDRWSARYATVFAEDPGTSVMTLTALGMAARSSPQRHGDDGDRLKLDNRTSVGAWKDQIRGWQSLRVPELDPVSGASNCTGTMLTIATRWSDEETLDGRGEPANAAVFEYQTAIGIEAETSFSAESIGAPLIPTDSEQLFVDVCELSLFTFYVDAIADDSSAINIANFEKWLLASIGVGAFVESPTYTATGEILQLTRESIKNRISVPHSLIPTPHLLMGIRMASAFIKNAATPVALSGETRSQLEWWSILHEHSQSWIGLLQRHEPNPVADVMNDQSVPDLVERCVIDARSVPWREKGNAPPKPEDKVWRDLTQQWPRIMLSVAHGILWAIHNRLSILRRAGDLGRQEIELLRKVESTINSDLSPVLKHYKILKS